VVGHNDEGTFGPLFLGFNGSFMIKPNAKCVKGRSPEFHAPEFDVLLKFPGWQKLRQSHNREDNQHGNAENKKACIKIDKFEKPLHFGSGWGFSYEELIIFKFKTKTFNRIEKTWGVKVERRRELS
jgi:hypothetical protein